MNPARFTQLERPRHNPEFRVGLGKLPPIPQGLGAGRTQEFQRFIGQVNQLWQTPSYALPNIETVRWHFDGPLSDAAVAATFGARIDPLGTSANSPPLGANSVESTMAVPGQFQTYTLVMAIGFHLEPEPLTFTGRCNAWTTPVTGLAQPVSPDDFALIDLNTTTGTLGLTGTQTMIPGIVDWGWWTEKGFWHMSRAYNLVWQWGQSTTIINDTLRMTAYTPTNGQEGAASSSEVDVNAFYQQLNAYYTSQLNSPYIALPVDRTRIGNMMLSGNAGRSVYRPTRAYETVGATLGGMGLRNQLRGNSEWRRLSAPFLLKPGVPIGLRADVKNSDDQAFMQQWLSASQLLNGVIPGDYTAYKNLNIGAGVTAAGAVGQEPSLDNPVTPQGITTITDRVVFKGGTWKLTVALKGFELTDDQAQALLTSPDARAALNENGCCCPSTS